MSASVCLYVFVCVYVFFLLPLLLLLLATCLRIEMCWSCPYRFTSCYIPWPPFSCLLSLSIFLGFFNFVALFLYTRLQFSCFFSLVCPSLSWLDLYYVYYIFPYEIHSLPLNTVCCFCCPPCFWHCDWTLTGYSLDKHLVCPFCRRKLIYCALNVPGRQVQVKSD